jgi:HTH-type transcriptional regulator, competence development regulator
MISNEFPEKLRAYRRLKGATLREVEKETGISNAYLNQLEQGKVKNPSPHILYKLAAFYKVPYDNLIKLAGYFVPNKMPAAQKAAGVAYSLLSDLSSEEEEELLKYLEFIRQKRRQKTKRHETFD